MSYYAKVDGEFVVPVTFYHSFSTIFYKYILPFFGSYFNYLFDEFLERNILLKEYKKGGI